MKFVTILFLGVIVMGKGQIVDSLHQELMRVESPEQKVDILNELAHRYTQISLDRAEQFANEARVLAVSIRYKKGVASSYNNLGISSSIRGQYTTGMEYFVNALRIRDTLNDKRGVSHIYNNMSRVFIYQGDYSKAIEYAYRSLHYLKEIDDQPAVGSAQVSLGSIYLSNHNYDSALALFTTARQLFMRSGRVMQVAWTQVKIVQALGGQGRYQDALEASVVADSLLKTGTDIFTTIEHNQSLGKLYTQLGKQNMAKHYLTLAMVQADKSDDGNSRMNARLALSDMFRKFKNHDSAWYYNDQYMRLRNDIFSAEKARQIASLEQLHLWEKKDQEIRLQHQQIKTQYFVIIIISIALVAVVALVFTIFNYYRIKKRSLVELKSLNNELYEKHEEILTQAEELTQANEEIKRINSSLEEEVSLRVAEVKERNKKLIDYAYFNAHKVRGPLSRILGLVTLMSADVISDEVKQYQSYLLLSAQELDEVIHEINTKLSI